MQEREYSNKTDRRNEKLAERKNSKKYGSCLCLLKALQAELGPIDVWLLSSFMRQLGLSSEAYGWNLK